MIRHMLCPIIQQLIEPGSGFHRFPQLFLCQTLVINHIRRLVIVIHHARRFIGSYASHFKICSCFLCSSQVFHNHAQIVVDMIILGAFQFPFSQVLRVL